MDFSKKLYTLRKQKGLSQEELAFKLNVSRQTISKWEVGETTPDMEKLVDLSNVFSVSLDELVLDQEKNNENHEEVKTDFQKNVNYIRDEVFNEKNRGRIKTILKYAGIVFLSLLAIELVAMIFYFLNNGVPGM